MAVTAFGVTDVDLGRLSDFRAVEVSAGQWVFVTSVTPTPDPDVWPDDWPPYPYTAGRWEFAYPVGVMPDESNSGNNSTMVGYPLNLNYVSDGSYVSAFGGKLNSSRVFAETEDFSCSVWAKRTGAYYTFVSAYATNCGWLLNLSVGGRTQMTIGDGSGNSAINAATTIPTNEWVMTTVVYDNSADKVYVYTNGTYHSANNMTRSLVQRGTAPSFLDTFTGYTSQLRVYHRTLTSNEVATLYSAGRTNATRTTISDTGLVLYYPMDFDYTTSEDTSYVGTNVLTLGAAAAAPTFVAETNTMSAYYLFAGDDVMASGANVIGDFSSTTGSVSFWFMPNGDGNDLDLLTEVANASGTTALSIYADERSTSDRFTIYCVIDGVDKYAADTANDTLDNLHNTWVHVVVRHNGTEPSIWINGVSNALNFRVGTDKTKWTKAVITDATSKASYLMIGRQVNGASFLNGSYDQPTWFNSVLTPAQILDLYYRESYDGKGFPRYMMNTNDVLACRPNAYYTNAVAVYTAEDPTFATGLLQDWRNTANCHGTVYGSTAVTINGNNGAILFDGINDEVQIRGGVGRWSSGLVSPTFNGKSAISMSAWIYVNAITAANQSIMVNYGAGTESFAGLAVLANTGYLRVSARSITGEALEQIPSTVAIATQQWVHVVGVIDYANDKIYGYTNGIEIIDSSVTLQEAIYTRGTGVSAPTYYDSIGSIEGATPLWFGGMIDEVTPFAVGLSPEEVLALYNATKGKFIP
jgi:hypothetical protein